MFLKTWSDVGTAAAGPGCCAVTTVPSQHVVARATAPRTTNLPPMACHLPTDLLLYRLGRVWTTGTEQRLQIALLHDGLQRATAFHHFSCEPFEDDGVAGLQVVRPPALAANGVRARELHVPVRHLAVFVLHVDVDAHMRIGPRDHRHHAFELHVLVGVVLRVEPVMREHRGGGADDGKRRDLHAELSHFQDLQMTAPCSISVRPYPCR